LIVYAHVKRLLTLAVDGSDLFVNAGLLTTAIVIVITDDVILA